MTTVVWFPKRYLLFSDRNIPVLPLNYIKGVPINSENSISINNGLSFGANVISYAKCMSNMIYNTNTFYDNTSAVVLANVTLLLILDTTHRFFSQNYCCGTRTFRSHVLSIKFPVKHQCNIELSVNKNPCLVFK